MGLEKESEYAVQLSGEELLYSPHDQKQTTFQPSNPAHRIMWSMDGGDSYQISSQIDLEGSKNPSLLNERTSYRWRPSHANFPELVSLRYRLLDDHRKWRSSDRVITYARSYESDLPIVSINSSEEGLFSFQDGIMVLGLEEGNQENGQQEWWFRNANYQQRGIEWEREANMQYIKDGNVLLDQNCGIRISGNATRCFPQKSMRIYARRAYGAPYFHFPFWENGIDETTSIVLRNSGNDNSKTLFADRFLHTISRECHVLVQEATAVNAFINGNYWGIYNLRERIDLQFVAEKKGCKIEEVTILENGSGELKDGLLVEKHAFDELMKELPEPGELSKTEKDKLASEISLKSFIDYIILETYFGNEDWPANNSMWYKTEDKKWKFILNDLDYTLAYSGNSGADINIFEKLMSSEAYVARLFRTLIAEKEFKKTFKKRVEELFESSFRDDHLEQAYRAVQDEYRADMRMAIDRWRVIKDLEEWEENCERNLEFLLNRQSIYLKQVEDL